MMTGLHRWRRWRSVTVLSLLPFLSVGWGAEEYNDLFASREEFFGTVKQDCSHLYLSRSRLLPLSAAFGAGALMANTNIDEEIQDWYQKRVRTDTGDEVSSVAKAFGEGKYLIPISLAAALVGNEVSPNAEVLPVGDWGARTVRAYLVGGPAAFLAQYVTGGSRPTEGDSRWSAFSDNNGVSGHAFIGAVPFLTAGRMCERRPLARYTLYAASALPALSRINDDAHYGSQAFLGWFLAWEATSAIIQTDRDRRQVSLAPMITDDGCGLSLCILW